MTEKLSANASLQPENSGSVSASAGSGKTWLLVSRIVRLLLDQQAARHIVAITFTRKAAGEMRQRLNERLLQFLSADDAQLGALLEQIDLKPEPTTMRQARSLYDNLLRQTHSIHCTTFHAFCQSLLQSFPLEAEIAPGFVLLEDSASLQNMAVDGFINECTQSPDSEASIALLRLIERFGNPSSCYAALKGFFNKRLDWQLYTLNQQHPAEFASQRLRQQLSLEEESYQLSSFFQQQDFHAWLEYSQLLARNAPSDIKKAVSLSEALQYFKSDTAVDYELAFEQFCDTVLTQQKQLRKRSPGKSQAKRLGDSGEARFLELHHQLGQAVLQELDKRLRYNHYEINQAWYRCGQRLLTIYRELKDEQSVLDFDDLEWYTYQLLFQSDAADWVQYRLDSRIDHILVDEFQDTNHFQWRLLHALLEEIAAGDNSRQRSCFIVGDKKQSIYGFRRAEPALFSSASNWLMQAMGARDYPLATSWRSSPIIMQFVNCLFEDGKLGLEQFPKHQTHLTQLSGSVELLPPIEKISVEEDAPNEDAAEKADFRHPLRHAREDDRDERYYREACRMASIIQQLTQTPHPLGGEVLDYDDIMILVRSRIHCHHYETALREAGIPYNGGGKANLFDCLEIQDILALLECLITPYKNLSLAHVLRSPIFHCNEHELQRLASAESSWYEYLLTNQWSDKEASLIKAQKLLPQWSSYASTLPTHDAIDRVYYQADIFNCYQRLAPAHLHGRIRQNLLQVMDMALEIDSGRYPSMEKFIWRLQQIKNADSDEGRDSQTSESAKSVSILTIHAAKGLEAKAVFLADAGYTPKDRSSHQACVKWPVEQEQPTHFVLLPSKQERDEKTSALAQLERDKSEKEQANLLYVALTRAKQYLYISAVHPSRGDNLGWYGEIREQCEAHNFMQLGENGSLIANFSGKKLDPPASGKPRPQASTKSEKTRLELPSFSQDPAMAEKQNYVVPSSLDHTEDIDDNQPSLSADNQEAQKRGNFIHKALEKLCSGYSAEQVSRLLDREYASVDENQRQAWLQQALTNFQAPNLQSIFNNQSALQAYSELSLNYFDSETQQYVVGQADRVVVLANDVLLVDYKSPQVNNASEAKQLLKLYQHQMQAYTQGLQLMWPERRIKPYILFTQIAEMFAISQS